MAHQARWVPTYACLLVPDRRPAPPRRTSGKHASVAVTFGGFLTCNPFSICTSTRWPAPLSRLKRIGGPRRRAFGSTRLLRPRLPPISARLRCRWLCIPRRLVHTKSTRMSPRRTSSCHHSLKSPGLGRMSLERRPRRECSYRPFKSRPRRSPARLFLPRRLRMLVLPQCTFTLL